MEPRACSKYRWGEISLSKIFLVFALAFMLCFAFALTAGAKYAGFTPRGQNGLTWDQAIAWMNANEVDPTLQETAHGGYVTTTTKCVVCHSAHRAEGIPEGIPSNTNQLFLTQGSAACENCHCSYGSQSTSLLVEWGRNEPGPHGSKGCAACHKGGIHGVSTSQFHVNNVFLLGGFGDAQINAEATELAQGPNSALWVPPTLTDGVNENPTAANTATVGNTWWFDGGILAGRATRIGGPNEIGELPGGGQGAAAPVNAAQYSAARSVATSYTCSQPGCHVNTAMANMQWGVGFKRDADGDPNTPDIQVTGHTLPAIMRTNGAYNGNGNRPGSACGPCHVGTAAGFPTAEFSVSRVMYGCDQCHDMIGVDTNSTAFPHGNRNIRVYEWYAEENDGVRSIVETETVPTKGNLWMYGGSIARIATGPFDPANPTANRPAANAQWGSISSFADLNWTVLTDLTSGTGDAHGATGQPGSMGLTDGACLKCHVPVDEASMDAKNSSGADATRHNFTFGSTAATRSGSQRLFLWR